jgi:monoamine oxidase
MLVSLFINASEALDIRDFNFVENEDVTVEQWVRKTGLWEQPQARGLAMRLTTSIVGREPREVGIHYFLDYIKSGYGLISLITEGKLGAQSRKIKEGATALVNALASNLSTANIHLSSPVSSITTLPSSGDYLVTTANNLTFLTTSIILAIPPHLYRKITFFPTLPSNKTIPFNASQGGHYAEVLLSYPSPWWRAAGLAGKFSSFLGPICFSWDTSTPSSEQYSLAIFIAGDIALEWFALPEDEKVPAVINHLVRLVPNDLEEDARAVQEVNFAEWTQEEYIWGAPASSLPPAYLRKYGNALREPVGSLYFAGTDLAYEWKGYMEGAITSGKRAAAEVLLAAGKEVVG